VLVALVAIPVILLLAMAGGFYFFGFITVVSALALHEYYTLVRAKSASPQITLGMIFGFCVSAVFIFNRLRYVVLEPLASHGIAVPLPSMAQLFLILFLLFVPTILIAELFRNKGSAVVNLSTTLFGVCYISLFLGTFIGLRELFVPGDFPFYRYFDIASAALTDEVKATVYRWGGLTIIAVLASIWICDTAAFHIGRSFGRHKLFPRVSPNKTWEGAIAGFLCGVIAFVAAKYLVLPYLRWLPQSFVGVLSAYVDNLGTWRSHYSSVMPE
jgi:phosphatidate cytidylyltransferase